MSTQATLEELASTMDNHRLLALAKQTREQYRLQVRDGHAVLDPGKLRRFDAVIADYEGALRR